MSYLYLIEWMNKVIKVELRPLRPEDDLFDHLSEEQVEKALVSYIRENFFYEHSKLERTAHQMYFFMEETQFTDGIIANKKSNEVSRALFGCLGVCASPADWYVLLYI